jgi:hypothetical protein
MLKSPDGIHSKFPSVRLCQCREPIVELGVLLDSQTFFRVLATAEVPKNFRHVRMWTEHLWRRKSVLKATPMDYLTFHNDGTAVKKGPVEKELDHHSRLVRDSELGRSALDQYQS